MDIITIYGHDADPKEHQGPPQTRLFITIYGHIHLDSAPSLNKARPRLDYLLPYMDSIIRGMEITI